MHEEQLGSLRQDGFDFAPVFDKKRIEVVYVTIKVQTFQNIPIGSQEVSLLVAPT